MEAYCSGGVQTRELILSATARKAFAHFYERVEARRDVGGDLQFLDEWSAKLCGQCARIAALLHLADTPGEVHREVSLSAVERSIYLEEEYLIPHAMAVAGGAPTSQLERVWSVLQAKGPTIKRGDLYRACEPLTSEDLTAILEQLTERNLIRIRKGETGRRGGKPPILIEVNPAAPETLRTNRTNLTNPRDGLTKLVDAQFTEEHKLRTNPRTNHPEVSTEVCTGLLRPTRSAEEPRNQAIREVSAVSTVYTRADTHDTEHDYAPALSELELPL